MAVSQQRAARGGRRDLGPVPRPPAELDGRPTSSPRPVSSTTPNLLSAYYDFWEPHTLTDPDVLPLFSRLRVEGLKVGVLSNTIWPREWHEEYFRRDGVLDLVDGAVYTSEIPWTKPAPEAFLAAMNAVGVEDPAACVYVGDRLFDDIWGASHAGMRTIWVPHSDIPGEQVGHTEGEPDAVVQRLAEDPGDHPVLGVVARRSCAAIAAAALFRFP